MSQDNPLVSVLIPVYNAESTLPICLKSLFRQTYGPLELVFVDDCSSDGSGDVIKTFAAEAGRTDVSVKIIRHETNGGVAAARNTALDAASGEYICSVDADDWLETDAIFELVMAARQEDADIVGFDWYLTFEQNERYMPQRHFSAAIEALRNMMCGVMRWNLWLFMVRRTLYEDYRIRFIPGMNMGEDMLVTMKLFLNAGKVVHITRPLYHYRQVNDSSVSRTFSDQNIMQVTENVRRVEMEISDSKYSLELTPYMDFLKQFIKLPLLMTTDRTQYSRWSVWFPESDAAIMRNTLVPLRTRLLEYAASRKWYVLVQLYYIFVYKFVYGILYR